MLVHGRKLWLLFPPRAYYGPHKMPMSQWFIEVLPSLPIKPIITIQEAGEMMFVPQGWAHGTINLNTCTGIAVEFGRLDV